MMQLIRVRILWVVSGLVLAMSVLSLRLVEIQIWQHQELMTLARKNHTFERIVHARRGSIVDCHGNLLATSVPHKRVIGDLFQLRDHFRVMAVRQRKGWTVRGPETIEQVADQLAPLIRLSPAELLDKLSDDERAYVVLEHRVELGRWAKIAELGLPGIKGEEVYVRRYTEGSSASHVVGKVQVRGDGSEVGAEGIEAALNRDLQGIDGWFCSEKDARQREIRAYRSQDAPPKHGHTVVLTVDQTIQQIVEEELDAAMTEHAPKAAYAMVMNPETGELMAMANRPTFDPNTRTNLVLATMRNRCITDVFEPGSTFKVVSVAAALEAGVVSLDDQIDCERGAWIYAGRRLTDTSAHGLMTVHDIVVKSSNIGTAKVALKLGQERLAAAIRQFGFDQRLLDGVLPGEASGRLRPVERWEPISISRVAIGYEVGVTPLQVITALSAIANKGLLMRPLLVREVLDAHGNPVSRFSPMPLRQVVRRDVAERLTVALVDVVSKEGTARRAAVEGFVVAGKTGTSKKWDAAARSYSDTKYLASFVGFLPAHDPKLCILVMIDEPSAGAIYGGVVAAPAFQAMATRIAQHLDLKPQLVPPRAVPMEVANR